MEISAEAFADMVRECENSRPPTKALRDLMREGRRAMASSDRSAVAVSAAGTRPTVEEFFGESAPEWRAAIEALHRFAQVSGCPAGGDVVLWFRDRTDALQVAYRDQSADPVGDAAQS